MQLASAVSSLRVNFYLILVSFIVLVQYLPTGDINFAAFKNQTRIQSSACQNLLLNTTHEEGESLLINLSLTLTGV